MGRYTFSFVLGLVAGAAGLLTYQTLRKRSGEESSDNLIEALGDKLHLLEKRFTGVHRDKAPIDVAS